MQPILVLAHERGRRAVRPDRHQPQQRVEIEAPQRARVVAHAQIALGDGRLGEERDREHRRRERDRQDRAARVQPDERDRDDHDLQRRAEDVAGEGRQRAQLVHQVRALGHVGHGPALEVAIAEPRDLAHEEVAELLLDRRAGPAQPPGERQLERQQRRQQRDDDAEKTARHAIEERAKQNRLDDGADRRQGDPGSQRAPPHMALAQQAHQLRADAHARFVDGRAQIARQRGPPLLVQRRRARYVQQHGAAHGDLRAAVLRGRRRRRGRVRRPRRRASRPGRLSGGLAAWASAASASTSRRASAPRATAPAVASSSTVRTARSRPAIADQPGSASARATSAAPSSICSARIRSASGPVKLSPPAHSRNASAGSTSECVYTSRRKLPARTQRRPRAGSMTCTQPPCARHTTTKWVNPDGSRITTSAGSASAWRRSK